MFQDSVDEALGRRDTPTASGWSVAQTLAWMDSFRHLVLSAHAKGPATPSTYDSIRAGDPSRRVDRATSVAGEGDRS